MRDEGGEINNGQSPVRAIHFAWLMTGVIILLSLYLVTFNPDNILGESESLNFLGIPVKTYSGQEIALQFVGASVIILGFLGTLHHRSRINWLTLSGIIGALLAMAGLTLQIGKDYPELSVIPGFMLFYLVLIWAIVGARSGLIWAWSKRKGFRR